MSHLTALKTTSKCQRWCLLLAGNRNKFRTACIFSQSLTQCQNGCGKCHGLLGRPQFSSLLSQTLLMQVQETALSAWPSASTERPGWWHSDSGKTTAHLTGKPFHNSLHQHLGYRHTASHRAFYLWELRIYSKKPKATSLICHERSRTLPMA